MELRLTIDATAHIIDRLICALDAWSRQNLNSVGEGIRFLREHDHPGLFLSDQVRRMMESTEVHQ